MIQAKTMRWAALGAAAIFGFAACGEQAIQPKIEEAESFEAANALDLKTQQFLDDNTIALPDTKYSQDLRIYKHVKAFDSVVMAQAVRTPTTLALPKAADARIADLQEGDVIVSEYDRGIFRMVLVVEDQGEHVLLQTRQAGLNEAVASGQLFFSKMANDSVQIPENFRPDVPVVRQQGLGIDGEITEEWEGIIDESWSFADQVNNKLYGLGVPDAFKFTKLNVDVEVGAQLAADYDVSVGWSGVDVDAGFTATTNGRATLDAEIEVSSKDLVFNFEKQVFLFSTEPGVNPVISIPKPAPLTLNSSLFPLTVNFAAAGQLKTMAALDGGDDNDFKVTGGATLTANLRAGVTGGIGRPWDAIVAASPRVSTSGPTFSGEKNFRAYAELTTSATVFLGESPNAGSFNATLTGSATITPLRARVSLAQLINADTMYCPNELLLEARGEATLNSAELGLNASLGPFSLSESFDLVDGPQSYVLYDKMLVEERSLLDIPMICDPNAEPPAGADNPTLAFKGKRQQCDGEGEGTCGIEGLVCFEQSCVTDGPLRVSMAWYNSSADLDLIILRPASQPGEAWEDRLIYWEDRGDENVGRYDFHSVDYSGALFAGRPGVESYFALNPPSGTYEVYVGRDISYGNEPTSFQLVVNHEGRELLRTGGNMSGALTENYTGDRAGLRPGVEKLQKFTFNIP